MNPRPLLLTLSFFSSLVHASDYYAGLSLGFASQDVSLDVVNNTVNMAVDINYVRSYREPDESAFTPSIFLGYRLGQDTALEIGMSRVAETSNDFAALDDNDAATDYLASESMESRATYVALVGFWPIDENWTMYGKLGVSSWHFSFAQTVIDNLTNDLVRTEAMSDSGSDIYYGLGGSYGYSPEIEIIFGLDIYSVSPRFVNINVKQEMTVLSLGVRMHF